MNMQKLLTISCMLLLATTAALTQKAKPSKPYTISSIKIVAYEESEGKIGDEVTKDISFGNDVSTSLLVTVELSGDPGSIEMKRNVRLTVTEGRKVISSRLAIPGILNSDGKYFIPLMVYGPLCDNIRIKATVTGQTTLSTMSRTVNAHCGE